MSHREHVVNQLGARRIEFVSTAIICAVFAVSFAHLEYYYIKDPALQISNGKVEVTDANFDRSRETKPIIGNMYQYHLFPMLFIFVLISFVALWDDITFKLLGRYRRRKALMLGFANLIARYHNRGFCMVCQPVAGSFSRRSKGRTTHAIL